MGVGVESVTRTVATLGEGSACKLEAVHSSDDPGVVKIAITNIYPGEDHPGSCEICHIEMPVEELDELANVMRKAVEQ